MSGFKKGNRDPSFWEEVYQRMLGHVLKLAHCATLLQSQGRKSKGQNIIYSQWLLCDRCPDANSLSDGFSELLPIRNPPLSLCPDQMISSPADPLWHPFSPSIQCYSTQGLFLLGLPNSHRKANFLGRSFLKVQKILPWSTLAPYCYLPNSGNTDHSLWASDLHLYMFFKVKGKCWSFPPPLSKLQEMVLTFSQEHTQHTLLWAQSGARPLSISSSATFSPEGDGVSRDVSIFPSVCAHRPAPSPPTSWVVVLKASLWVWGRGKGNAAFSKFVPKKSLSCLSMNRWYSPVCPGVREGLLPPLIHSPSFQNVGNLFPMAPSLGSQPS